MRTHKYKVFANGKMSEPFDLTQNPKFWADKLQDGVLLQYTGLKDTNGKEIYEGDIIEILSWRKERFKVVFESGMFRAVRGESKVSLATFKGEVGCEVIGNIYENLELLDDVSE